jgi:hypothetical protein
VNLEYEDDVSCAIKRENRLILPLMHMDNPTCEIIELIHHDSLFPDPLSLYTLKRHYFNTSVVESCE